MYQNGMNGMNNMNGANGYNHGWNNNPYPSAQTPFQGMGQNYPYQQPPSYYQQAPQIKTNKTIPGRIINSIDEITPNDVPMDGMLYPFIMQDNSCVYGKRWNSNGQIETTVFIPKPVETVNNTSNENKAMADNYEKIVSAFQTMNERIAHIEKLLAPLASETGNP